MRLAMPHANGHAGAGKPADDLTNVPGAWCERRRACDTLARWSAKLLTTWCMVAGSVVTAQRPGGQILLRTDEAGRTYYEVRSEHPHGNHGGPVPMRLENGQPNWPRSVTVSARSFWRTKPEGTAGADVKPSGSPLSKDSRAHELPAPALARWALIARWVTLDEPDLSSLPVLLMSALTDVPTASLGPWVLVGDQNTIDVPIPAALKPTRRAPGTLLKLFLGPLASRSEFHYVPLLGLQYKCNEYPSEHDDNSGWLHVYEQWNW
jgi:hypothetical protein